MGKIKKNEIKRFYLRMEFIGSRVGLSRAKWRMIKPRTINFAKFQKMSIDNWKIGQQFKKI